MPGRRAVALIVALGLGALAAPVSRAADGDEFIGSWQGSVDGYQEVWTIKKDGDKWSVKIVYSKSGKEMGLSSGADVKFADGMLSFTQKLDKRPPGVVWIDDAGITIKKSGDKLTYTWTAGGSSGSRNLTKPGKESAELVGKWKNVVDGV